MPDVSLKMAGKLSKTEKLRRWSQRLKTKQKLISIFNDIVMDPLYQENLKARARAGEIHPSLEVAIWHYLAGKPVEEINVHASDKMQEVSEMNNEQLGDRIAVLHQRLEMLKAQEQAQEQTDQEAVN